MSGKDFSVDAQRRMFQETQERERAEAEAKKASRKIKQATAGAAGGVALSGLMANLESDKPKTVTIGDDDDDSLGDDYSLGSEESFYVGIERADYAQPNNLEMYGEEEKDDYEIKEDRLGISRVSIAIVNREDKAGLSGSDWDAAIPIHADKSSSLHDFMNGSVENVKASRSKKDTVVAMPIIGTSLEWKEEAKLGDADDAAVDQVYQHRAAEGKMFIEKMIGGDSSGVATPGAMATPGAKSAVGSGAGGGTYPVISPMALFSPGITTPGTDRVVEGEDNAVRQMRERELKKNASAESAKKMTEFKKFIATNKDGSGKVDAFRLMKQLEKMMEEQ